MTQPTALLRAEGAYQAYAATTGNKNFRGEDMPAFADLPQTIKDAWVAAAAYAATAYLERGPLSLATPERRPMATPITPGRFVAFNPANSHLAASAEPYGAKTLPAIVAHVWNQPGEGLPGCVNLTVIMPDGRTEPATSIYFRGDMPTAEPGAEVELAPVSCYWPPRS